MSVEKRSWGAVNGGNGKPADRAPSLPLGGAGLTPVTLRDIDVSKLEVGKEIKKGSIGDRFVELTYEGKRVAIQFGKFWEYKRSPFKAGAPKMNPDAGWGMLVEIEQDEYEAWLKVEEKLLGELAPKCSELFEHTQKAPKPGKEPKKMTVQEFEGSFNSVLRAADPDKGYKANFKVHVQHEEVGADGKPRRMPKITKANLKSSEQGYGYNKEEVGTVHDLERNTAISPIATLSRGIYFGTTGWGLKFTLDSAKIWKNMSGNSGPTFDESDRIFFPESDDEDEKPTKKLKVDPESQVRPFVADALIGFDDGSGTNGVAEE